MYQHIEVIGRLGRKPEMKYTPYGNAVTSFSVATDNQYTNGAGEKIKETTWFRVEVWGKMAEACNQYLDKGSLVFVSGRLKPDKETGAPRIWEKDGKPASSFEINATEVKFLTPKSSESKPAQSAPVDDGFPF